MPILDTFTILFKSNAKDVKKDMAEAEKSTKDFQQQISSADKITGSLASSLLKVGVEAVVAFATFEGLKSGITDAINFNAQLEKTHILTGLSSRELATYDATFAQFGANSGDFTNWLSAAAKNIQLTNGNVANVIPNLLKFADQLQHAGSEAEALQQFRIKQEQWNLPDSLFLGLRQGSEAFEKMANSRQDFVAANEELSRQGLEIQSQWKELESVTISAFSGLMPFANAFLYILQGIAQTARIIIDLFTLQGWKDLSTTGTFRAFTDLFTLNGWKDLAHGMPNKSSVPVSSSTGSSPVSSSTGSSPLGIRNNNPGNLRSWGHTPTSGGFAQFGSLDEGLTAEQKQLQLYGNRGINTLSGIASTWAPSSENNTSAYIAGLVKSTGFSANQKLDLNDPEVRAAVANAINKQEEGSAYANLITSAHAAIAAADTSPFNSTPDVSGVAGTTQTISIGNVTINSPTGDPADHAKLFKQNLDQHLSFVNANMNDGIKS